MMVALLLYAYCLGERSSRRIERLCQRDVAFRVITANQSPDHTTIARFRQPTNRTGHALHTGAAALCEAGLVKVGSALDGTKIQAYAALASNRTVETITAEVSRMLTEAQATDTPRIGVCGACGDELPEALRDRTSRLTRLQACQERLSRAATPPPSSRPRSRRGAEEAATGRRSEAANRRRQDAADAPPRRM